jgi:hypothetical protein
MYKHITNWTIGQKVLFRFCTIYFILAIAPWTLVNSIPYLSLPAKYWDKLNSWIVELANKHFFHVREVLVPINGSGDTSFGWAQLWLYLSLATIGTIIWSILDRKRPSYNSFNYWICTMLRYFIAAMCFSYGIIKLFGQQMYFPSISQLATPLGDYLPMRFSWLFIGYSTPYQFFSGAIETLVGLLLIYRRTTTLGVVMAVGVFLNVFMLNMSYDIPVKLFSAHILVYSLYLLMNEYKRVVSFFILQQPTTTCSLYHYPYTGKKMKWLRIGLKILFVATTIVFITYDCYSYYAESEKEEAPALFTKGVYEVKDYVVNGDTIAPLITDTLRWKDFIIDNSYSGSVNSSDTLFRKRYGRGYFEYRLDSLKQHLFLVVKKDTIAHFTIDKANGDAFMLKGNKGKDSLYVFLQKSNRHFQLAEKQFHALSEYNR